MVVIRNDRDGIGRVSDRLRGRSVTWAIGYVGDRVENRLFNLACTQAVNR